MAENSGSQDEKPAYAKLWGRGEDGSEFTAYITKLPTRLGRGGEIEPSADFIVLGNAKGISRHHATIDWVPTKNCFCIICHSKNGMIVHQEYFGKDSKVYLSSKSALKILDVSVYFLLADNNTEEADGEDILKEEGKGGRGTSDDGNSSVAGSITEGSNSLGASASAVKRGPPLDYQQWVYEAFMSPELKKQAEVTGIKSVEVIDWLHNALLRTTGDHWSRRQLSNGVHNVLGRKCVKVGPKDGKGGFYWQVGPGLCSLMAAKRKRSDLERAVSAEATATPGQASPEH